jgi:signal peptidase II
LRKYWDRYGLLVVISGIIIILDQLSKNWIRTNLAFTETWSPWPWLAPYARFVHWHNTGVAFGLFQGFGIYLTLLAFIIAILIIYYYPRVPREDWSLKLAMAMQLGGALGNLVDRIQQGYVTDFISIGDFPVFNIADSSITIGVVVLLLGVWLQERREKKSLANLDTQPTE